jgi:lysophospholipase L1-like esterase
MILLGKNLMRSTKTPRRLLVLAAVLTLGAMQPCRGGNAPDFGRWEKEIAAFEAKDMAAPPPKDAILFAGSSSIRLWNLKKSFPDLGVINRGFGGSQIADSTHFAPRIILKVQPRVIVFYAGDNDVANGRTAEQVFNDFKDFADLIHKELPKTRIVFISIKPSPARLKMVDEQQKANGLIEAYCKKNDTLTYIDAATPMLGENGKPRQELFGKDGLHMNDKGYALWASLLKAYLK